MDDFIRSVSMDDLLFYLIIAGTICVIFIVYRASRRRHEDLVDAAFALGFFATPLIAHDIKTAIEKFRLFHERSMTNAGRFAQKKDHDFNLSIFNVDMSGLTTERGFAVTVAHVRLHDHTLPNFVLETPSFVSIVKGHRAIPIIRFSDHPKFSRKFWLGGEDEQAIRDFFTPRLIAFFGQKKKAYQKFGIKLGPIKFGGIFPCLEARGNEFIFFFEGKAIVPERLPVFIDETEEMIKALTGEKIVGWS